MKRRQTGKDTELEQTLVAEWADHVMDIGGFKHGWAPSFNPPGFYA